MFRIPEEQYLNRNYRKVKENVWKMEDNKGVYSVKKYHSFAILQKVTNIHEALATIQYPHIVPALTTQDSLFFVQHWLLGAKAMNFSKRRDRIDSLAALHTLHLTNKEIAWEKAHYLHPYPLLNKWERRFERFRQIHQLCEKYLSPKIVSDLLLYSENALIKLRKQKQSMESMTLLHGDVVHHNILRDTDGVVRLIDFDLACLGSPSIELALWTHRVLPQIDYDITFLFNEQPLLHKMDAIGIHMLLFPNEVLREWLHFSTLPPDKQRYAVHKLVSFTEQALSYWPKLWYDVERINH